MPSVEAKIQRYINFNKNQSKKWDELTEQEKSKEAAKSLGCGLGSATIGALAWPLTGFDTKKATNIANDVYDKCKDSLNKKVNNAEDTNDEVDSIFKNSDHELKKNPLK